jgi:D-tyrosyl-tRNA(Tyr) deacylase
VFERENAMWKASVTDIGGDVLCVSQFTLLANTTKGSKPDFHRAMVPILAPSSFVPLADQILQATKPSQEMYSAFLARMRTLYQPERVRGRLLCSDRST